MAGFTILRIYLILPMILCNKSNAQTNISSSLNLTNQNLDSICGTIAIKARPLIAYGQSTNEGEFPWHTALYYSKNSNLSYICGGSLISRSHVITAAHCVTRPKTNIPVRMNKLLLHLGQYFFRDFSNSTVQERKASNIVPHSQYNAQSYGNDIALVKLEEPAEITDYVRPICLWQESSEIITVINRVGIVVGWGSDEKGGFTKKLMQAKMPVVSNGKCALSFPDFFLRYLSTKSFCAGFQNGTTVCNGDSGGGLAFRKVNSNPSNPTWQLRGLVSIGTALQNQGKCDLLHYTIFTDVAEYLDWIEKTMQGCDADTKCSTTAATKASPVATESQTIRLSSTVDSDSFTSSPTLPVTTASPATTESQTVTSSSTADITSITLPSAIPIRNYNLNYTCGSVIPRPRPLITYGLETREGEFPWHTAIFYAVNNDLKYACGASLVSKRHVITSAHCVTRSNSVEPLDTTSLIIFLGMSNLRRFYSPGIQQADVEDILIHPQYKVSTYDNDIALIKFKSSVEVTDYVRPVCIWEESQDLDALIGRQGNIAGWGLNERANYSQELIQANMVVVSQEYCLRSSEFYVRFTSINTLCAGFRNGTSVCNGDSGGGLVFPILTSNPKNPRWQLRGLASILIFGSLNDQSLCDSFQYTIFTDGNAKYKHFKIFDACFFSFICDLHVELYNYIVSSSTTTLAYKTKD